MYLSHVVVRRSRITLPSIGYQTLIPQQLAMHETVNAELRIRTYIFDDARMV
jgi:hypothetical protein